MALYSRFSRIEHSFLEPKFQSMISMIVCIAFIAISIIFARRGFVMVIVDQGSPIVVCVMNNLEAIEKSREINIFELELIS